MRRCKAAQALDKLQRARETNRTHIRAGAAVDPAPAAIRNAQLQHALCGRDQTRVSRPRPGGVAASAAPTHDHDTARMLDEAEAILADIEGPAALEEMREIAARNGGDLTPRGDVPTRATRRRHPG